MKLDGKEKDKKWDEIKLIQEYIKIVTKRLESLTMYKFIF